jgi:hypothetical protein
MGNTTPVFVVRARGDEQGRERRVAKDAKFEKLKESYILEKDANAAIYKEGIELTIDIRTLVQMKAGQLMSTFTANERHFNTAITVASISSERKERSAGIEVPRCGLSLATLRTERWLSSGVFV